MRSYARVSPLLWIGRTGKSLRGDPESQVVMTYLLTSPHSNSIGLYYLPISYICSDTGISNEGASKAIRRLSEGGFMGYDRSSEVVFVYEMAKWQIGDSLNPADKQVKGIQAIYDALPENIFLTEFFDKYADCFHLKNRRGFQGPSKGLRSTETETEKRTPLPPITKSTDIESKKRKAPGQQYAPEFERFWAAFPKKVSKGAAYKAWKKEKPPLDACLKTLAWQTKTLEWTKDSGQFIPHPSTWLNARGWENQPLQPVPPPNRVTRFAY